MNGYKSTFLAIGLCLVGILAACGSTPSQTVEEGNSTSTPAPSPSPLPTATLATFNGYPTVAPDACPTTTNTALNTWVPFPANALIIDQYPTNIDGVSHSFTFQPAVVCVPSTTPSAIRAFYAATMPKQGWVTSMTYPYNGNLQAACGDQYCWKKPISGTMMLAVSLEDVRIVGTMVRFVIRFVSYS